MIGNSFGKGSACSPFQQKHQPLAIVQYVKGAPEIVDAASVEFTLQTRSPTHLPPLRYPTPDARFWVKNETVQLRLPKPELWALGVVGPHFRNLWMAQQAKNGDRPLPAEYLKELYLRAHSDAFSNGAAFLVPVEILNQYGREKLGRPCGQFVMTKAYVDEILKRVHGNTAMLERFLGLPPGSWAGKSIARIDIKPEVLAVLNLRPPTGNTACANEYWEPGTFLPEGGREAMIDQPVRGQYIETVVI